MRTLIGLALIFAAGTVFGQNTRTDEQRAALVYMTCVRVHAGAYATASITPADAADAAVAACGAELAALRNAYARSLQVKYVGDPAMLKETATWPTQSAEKAAAMARAHALQVAVEATAAREQ